MDILLKPKIYKSVIRSKTKSSLTHWVITFPIGIAKGLISIAYTRAKDAMIGVVFLFLVGIFVSGKHTESVADLIKNTILVALAVITLVSRKRKMKRHVISSDDKDS